MDDTTAFASWLDSQGPQKVLITDDGSPNYIEFQIIPRNPLALNHSVMMKEMIKYDFWVVSSSPASAAANAIQRFKVVGGASPTKPDPFVE